MGLKIHKENGYMHDLEHVAVMCAMHHARSECTPSSLNTSGHISIGILKCSVIALFTFITMLYGTYSIAWNIYGLFPHSI